MLSSSQTFLSTAAPKIYSRLAAVAGVSCARSLYTSTHQASWARRASPMIFPPRHFTSMAANKGMIIRGRGDMSMEEIPMPGSPQRGECLIRVEKVGICGSDVHFYKNGAVGGYVVRSPMVIGHEGAGVIEQLGEGVSGLQVGDRVALEPAVPCGHCDLCKSGKYNLCPDIKCFGTPPNNGCLTRYVRHPASLCFKLPENVSLEEGVMCEPLAVATYGCKDRAEVKAGDKVLVFGDGPIGTMSAMVSFALGAARVLVCGHHSDKLQGIVEACPRAEVLNVKGAGDYTQVAEKIRDTLEGPANCSVDTTGAQDAMSSCIKATQSGGRVAMVGIGAVEMELPVVDALIREVDIRGTFRFRNTYPTCIDMISKGKVDVKQLVTHRYHFNNDEVLQAFEDCSAGVGKSVVKDSSTSSSVAKAIPASRGLAATSAVEEAEADCSIMVKGSRAGRAKSRRPADNDGSPYCAAVKAAMHPSQNGCALAGVAFRFPLTQLTRSASSFATATRKREVPLLFTPGPLTTTARVKEAMLVDLGSRDTRFTDVVVGIRNRLLALGGVSKEEGYECVIVQGAGTHGIEAVLGTAIPRGGKILILANGAYGQRQAQICHYLGIEYKLIDVLVAPSYWP
ncbi:hypothetical protein FOZ62_021477 [Perkinsus olseni]|uniref:Enoyl reductase (ER) domain-containing protein n=1 Tax=Perkinsus olseni TaxID=32597 RepID=A0A7J6RLP0_PEROL|nr:hypothetical protein FOZ62_021477 [Perkinsus olseni]